jgi:hypothetical protein
MKFNKTRKRLLGHDGEPTRFMAGDIVIFYLHPSLPGCAMSFSRKDEHGQNIDLRWSGSDNKIELDFLRDDAQFGHFLYFLLEMLGLDDLMFSPREGTPQTRQYELVPSGWPPEAITDN